MVAVAKLEKELSYAHILSDGLHISFDAFIHLNLKTFFGVDDFMGNLVPFIIAFLGEYFGDMLEF